MATCRHCGEPTNLSTILCDPCAGKALHQLPADPKERIQVYDTLLESDNGIIRILAAELKRLDAEALEAQQMDSWMYDSREA